MNAFASVRGGATMHTGIEAQQAAGHSSLCIPPRCSSSRDQTPAPEGKKTQPGIKASTAAKLGIFLAVPNY